MFIPMGHKAGQSDNCNQMFEVEYLQRINLSNPQVECLVIFIFYFLLTE